MPAAGPARELAYNAIRAFVEDGIFVSDSLNDAFQAADYSLADRRLATELANGVIRRRRTLDCILRAHLARPDARLQADLRAVFQLGIYQLVFSSIPAYAAVNETIAVARNAGFRRQVKFLNGVLRNVGRSLTDDDSSEPGPRAVPLEPGRYRLLARDVFSAEVDSVTHLAESLSFPGWLIERWANAFDSETLRSMLFWLNAPPPLSLRTNRMKTSPIEYLQQLESAGVSAHMGTAADCVISDSERNVIRLPGFADGLCSVQDETAMQAGYALDPQPGERILDLCAAPGSKTCHLAELSRDQADIIACDISEQRLRKVEENAERLGLNSIRTQVVNRSLDDLPAGPFDAILLDVPCSNTGVMGRRPEARWRISAEDLKEFPEIQQPIIRAAVKQLKPGGRMLYSTCSIDRSENEAVVERTLEEFPALSCEQQVSFMPGQPADGGFQALFRSQ